MSIVRSRPLYLLLVVAAAACGTLAGADDTSPSAGPDAGGVDGTSPPPPGDDAGDPVIEIEGGADVTTTPGHRYAFVSAGTNFGYSTPAGLTALCTTDAAKITAWSGRKFVAFVAGAHLDAGTPWFLPGDTKRVFDGTTAPTPTSFGMVPEVAIDVDVVGNPIRLAEVLVWTGSKGNDCTGWTNNALVKADIANAVERTNWLWVNTNTTCTVKHHVYCFEE
jgi:hypothetical protein